MRFPDTPPIAPTGDEISTEEFIQLKALARRDLFFFSKGILGYDKMTPRTHRSFCRFFDEPGPRRRLALMPRSHFKTTIGTIADTMRRVAIDPNIRVLIANATQKNAQGMLTEIKNHILHNERFRAFFPELIPENTKKTTWAADAILLPRKATWREPTITTIGTGGEVVSRHFELMKFDDLIGGAHFRSPTEMEAAIQWLKHSVSLLVSLREGEIHMIGTRWSMEDIYSFAMEKMGFDPFIRKAIVRGPDGPEPFFPEMVAMSDLRDIIETDPFHWATQYANDPYDTADADFRSDWLQYYRIAPDGNIRYTDSDGSTAIQETNKLRVYAHVDPSMGETASADHSAVIVVGVAPNGNIYILDVWKKRIDPLGLIDKMFQVHSLWAPRLISIESVGYQRSLKYYVESEAKRRGTYIRIEPYLPGTRRNKEARIRQTLQPYFSTGAIFLQSEHFELIDEYLAFPRKHPDALDALAQGPEYWKPPEDIERLERFERLRESYEKQGHGVTGYGI